MINLIDGQEYVVTFNNGQDTVKATYMEEHQLFSHFMGSVEVKEVDKIENVES